MEKRIVYVAALADVHLIVCVYNLKGRGKKFISKGLMG